MRFNNHFSKSISVLLLFTIVHMHLCSFMCSFNSGGCCNIKNNSSKERTCCSKKSGSDQKTNDCQNLHFSFFNKTGQFFSQDDITSLYYFQSIINAITNSSPFLIVFQKTDIPLYNIFHPPLPTNDIRVFIQSFLI